MRESEIYTLAACCDHVMCEVAVSVGAWGCRDMKNLRNPGISVTVGENGRKFR